MDDWNGDKYRNSKGRGLGEGANTAISGNYVHLKNWSEGIWNDLTGKSARMANERAAKEAEKARIMNAMKEFGARQQADQLSMSNLVNVDKTGSTTASKNAGGGISNKSQGGTIGAQITSAGTF